MPLPAVIDSEDELPEGMTDYYEQDDNGRYVLSLDNIDSHPRVDGLSKSLQRRKREQEDLRKERDKFKETASLIPEDVDQETLQQALERIRNGDQGQDNGQQDQGAKQGQQGQDVAKVREQLERRYQKEIEQRDQAIQQRDQQLQKMVVDSSLSQALRKAGITDPDMQEFLEPRFRQEITVRQDDNGSPYPVVETDLGEDVSIEQRIKDWTQTEAGQKLMRSLYPDRGSGAQGSGPRRGGSKEITRQQFEKMSENERMQFFKNGGKIAQ